MSVAKDKRRRFGGGKCSHLVPEDWMRALPAAKAPETEAILSGVPRVQF